MVVEESIPDRRNRIFKGQNRGEIQVPHGPESSVRYAWSGQRNREKGKQADREAAGRGQNGDRLTVHTEGVCILPERKRKHQTCTFEIEFSLVLRMETGVLISAQVEISRL